MLVGWGPAIDCGKVGGELDQLGDAEIDESTSECDNKKTLGVLFVGQFEATKEKVEMLQALPDST